jgi:hypothetical protein
LPSSQRGDTPSVASGPPERPLITPELLRRTTATGTPADVLATLDEIAAAGCAGVLYAPAGPDIPRELRTTAAVALA